MRYHEVYWLSPERSQPPKCRNNSALRGVLNSPETCCPLIDDDEVLMSESAKRGPRGPGRGSGGGVGSAAATGARCTCGPACSAGRVRPSSTTPDLSRPSRRPLDLPDVRPGSHCRRQLPCRPSALPVTCPHCLTKKCYPTGVVGSQRCYPGGGAGYRFVGRAGSDGDRLRGFTASIGLQLGPP